MQSHTALGQSGTTPPPAPITALATISKTAARPPLTEDQQKKNDTIFAASVGYNTNRVNKAAAAIAATKQPTRPQRQALNAALDALAAAKPDNGQQAAQQFSVLRRHRALDRLDLDQFAANLLRFTDWPQPQKKFGAVETKAGKLTKTGLLFRYHAFLAHELTNLSIELYGCASYAFQMIPMDGYVQRRIDPPGWPRGLGKHLPKRAAKVMGSLRIDTKHGDSARGFKASKHR
jgi:hypothetical protein